MDDDEFYSGLTDKQRREMYSLGENGCVNNVLGTIGCLAFLILGTVFLVLCTCAEYDTSGQFIKWVWQ